MAPVFFLASRIVVQADFRMFPCLLERPDLSGHDFYLFAADLPYDKAVEAFVVRAAVVAQKPDCLSFPRARMTSAAFI